MNEKFLTPDDVKSMVKVFITPELRETINNNIKDMVSNNKKTITICTLDSFNPITIKDIMKEMCLSGWRVSRRQNDTYFDSMHKIDIVLENPYYKSNKIEEIE